MAQLYTMCSEFFVFNPTLARSEEEEDNKILFYHPAPTPGATQHRQVGLCEAIIHFAQPFGARPLESIHTEKRAYFLYTPEPDLWLAMVMENPKRDLAALAAAAAASAAAAALQPATANPSSPSPAPQQQQQQQQQSSSSSSPLLHAPPAPSPAAAAAAAAASASDEECACYQEDYWRDETMLAVLATVYRMFRMFHGPVARIVETRGRDAAADALRRFLPAFVLNIEWARVDLFTTLAGIHFLPVNKNVYLHVQRFVNLTEDVFPQIRYTSVMYRDNLIWSELGQEDIRVLYRVLVSHMYEGQADIPAVFQSVSARLKTPHQSRFVTGGPQEEGTVPPLGVFLADEQQQQQQQQQQERHSLVIYRYQDLVCLFLLKGDASDLPAGFYQLLDAHIVRHMSETMLVAIIGEHHQRKSAFDEQYRYVYFNHMNLALKTSLKGKGADLTPATMAILNEMHDEFERSAATDAVCEVLVRTANDRWIVGRRSEQREFYIIFDNNKNANLIEINEEVKKLSTTYFQSIFITE